MSFAVDVGVEYREKGYEEFFFYNKTDMDGLRTKAWQDQHDLAALPCVYSCHWIHVSPRETFSKRLFTEKNGFQSGVVLADQTFKRTKSRSSQVSILI
jgi:hypothetical protein